MTGVWVGDSEAHTREGGKGRKIDAAQVPEVALFKSRADGA